MPGISKKRLDAVRKGVELAFADDEDALEQVTKGLDGLAVAIEKGETVTSEDLADVLGEVVVEKVATKHETAEDDVPQDPIAPIIKALFESTHEADGSIKKGMKAESVTDAYQGAYEAILKILDDAIDSSVSQTVAEITKGGKKPAVKDPAERDGDGDMDDMEKILKSAGIPSAVIKKIGSLQTKVDALEADKALTKFEKMAEDLGEGKAFGKTLMALSDADKAGFDEIVKRLKGKNELLRKNDLWKREVGEGGTSAEGLTALQQLSGHAEELRKSLKRADGKPVSIAKAFTEACSQHPELYQEYQRERAAR